MDKETHDKLIYAHAALMIFVWMVAVPFAVGANMYARKNNLTWGPKVHMIVMSVAVLIPLGSSLLIAQVAAGRLKLKPHSLIGVCLCFISFFQILLGVGNHLLYRYRKDKNMLPASRPWNNKVHIWLGRILLLLALVNIPLGMRIKRPPIAAYILYAIWLTALTGAFTWLIWMKPKGNNNELDDDDENDEYVDKPEEIEQVSKP